MKRLIAWMLMLPSLLHAAAPESIAGKVYHEFGGIARVRAKWESIVSFRSDGRYTFLKRASGSSISNPVITLQAPPADGTYTYTRTSETTARVTLNDPTRTLIVGTGPERTDALSIELSFSDSATGPWESSGGGGRFYLTEFAATAPLANMALRANVAPNRPAVAGFVVPGDFIGARKRIDLLIRLVGPSLAQFGVANGWTDPDFTTVVGPANSYAHLGDWGGNPDTAAALQKLFAAAGAFPLLPNSKDAVAVVSLYPGAYTIQCSASAGDAGGEALIEIYTLP